ncbi:cytochrome p450 714c2 [Quercus suber]|uniref:Cytochrome p450 714c2 n=1 Tax=Quercus suber TaxID=58331 RepID=A0AAW0KNQ0_QUESU
MEANPILMAKITVSVVIGGFIVLLMQLYNLSSKTSKASIRGPSPSFFFGNIPEMKRIQLQVHSTPKTTATNEYDHPDLLMTGLPLSSHI